VKGLVPIPGTKENILLQNGGRDDDEKEVKIIRSLKSLRLFTGVNKFQFRNISKGILRVRCGNILSVTFLKIFLENTICSGKIVFAPTNRG
jgi:hypothetical protein